MGSIMVLILTARRCCFY